MVDVDVCVNEGERDCGGIDTVSSAFPRADGGPLESIGVEDGEEEDEEDDDDETRRGGRTMLCVSEYVRKRCGS